MSQTTPTTRVRKLESLPADTVLTGLPVATVDVTPDELSRRVQLKWSDLDSELGPVRVAVVRLPNDTHRFALSSYREAPWESVTIEADGTATEADVDALLRRLQIKASEVADRVPVRAAEPGRTEQRLAGLDLSEVAAQARPERASTGGQPRPDRRTRSAKSPARKAGRRKGQATRATEAFRLVANEPGITIPELAQKMGINQNYLYRVMPGLEKEGKVRKKGRGWHPAAHRAQRA
jgi:hypothetical protein